MRIGCLLPAILVGIMLVIATIGVALPFILIGLVIWIIYRVVKRKKSVSKKDVVNMTGLDFEYYCANILHAKGFRDITVTPSVGDYGADIVATSPQGERWVFQCKMYRSKLGNSPIQEVVASKPRYGASRACVMTNSTFTENAQELAMCNDVVLWEMID